jgi:asparagine synthase (glutamine-hydrolysing)
MTLFKGISKLPPGCSLTWVEGTVSIEPWWSPSFDVAQPRSDEDWIEGLVERLDDAVGVHLESDVEVGAFLSGGLDSSIVTSAMSRITGESVRTFAVGSDDASFDERPFAQQVAEHCRTRHTESTVSAEQLRAIPELVRCLDEPSDPISACFHESARLASGHVKVVLGGDGGDELLAGYDRYAAFSAAGMFGRVPAALRNGILRPIADRMRLGFGYKEVAQKARWLLDMADEDGGRRYASMTTFFRFAADQRDAIYGPAMRAATEGVDPESEIVRAFERAPTEAPLNRMLFTDLVMRFPEHVLMLSDRLSMAHGLEVRAPLLDNELADYCLSIPAHLKIRGRQTKVALRMAAKGRLPEAIIRRGKQGFMFPVAQWLEGSTADAIVSELETGPLVKEGWIDRLSPSLLMNQHQARSQDNHVRIWMLLNLDAWYRIYVDGERP